MDPRQQQQGNYQGQQYGNSFQENAAQAAPLNDTLKNLKYKYVELQDKHKQESRQLDEAMGQLRTEFNLQTVMLQNSEKDRQELNDAMASLKEHNISEKDKLYGEALSLRKKLQASQSDLSRMELHYQRINSERQKLMSENSQLEAESKKFTFQIDEQLAINTALKSRAEELRKSNSQLTSSLEDVHAMYSSYDLDKNQAMLKDSEKFIVDLKSQLAVAETRQKQEETLRHRVMEDCSELVKQTVNVKAELEDVQRRLRKEFEQREEKIRHKQDRLKDFEAAREELARNNDDLQMSRISIESKEGKINELVQKVYNFFYQKNKSVESALTKALDTQRVMEDRIIDLENRLRIGESEVIQLGQDKSLLIDDVGELRNATEINSSKVKTLLRDKQELQVKVAKYEREMNARKEFSKTIAELEHSGENYLGLMRNMKTLISSVDGAGTDEEIRDD
jgi:chromosome segregation ATPase